MKKRTKIIILSLMIVLLGVTGYLNIVLNNSIKETNVTVTAGSYFSSYRNDRTSTRDQELLYYDAIIESGEATDADVVAAKQAKLDLVARMDEELTVEGLIKAQGFSDCVIAITKNKVNVVVQAESLTDLEVARICSTVTRELECPIRNIVIFYAE